MKNIYSKLIISKCLKKGTKRVIEKPLKKEIQHNGKRIIGQTAIYKTLHKKLKIENELH